MAEQIKNLLTVSLSTKTFLAKTHNKLHVTQNFFLKPNTLHREQCLFRVANTSCGNITCRHNYCKAPWGIFTVNNYIVTQCGMRCFHKQLCILLANEKNLPLCIYLPFTFMEAIFYGTPGMLIFIRHVFPLEKQPFLMWINCGHAYSSFLWAKDLK